MKGSNYYQQANKVVSMTEVPKHVEVLYEETCQRKQLSEDMQADLKALLTKHAGLFSENDRDLGRANLVVHDIGTGDAQFIHQSPRRTQIALQPDLDKELDTMLKEGARKPGQSPWISPVVLVKERWNVRFCKLDYGSSTQ